METVIAVVFLCAGLNLVLWGALYRKLAGLPGAFLAQARRERTEGEARAMAVLQETAAAKVGSITLSLRSLEEQTLARHRDERAAVELRARVAERRGSETLPALGAAQDLVRELRSVLDTLLGSAAETHEPAADRITPLLESEALAPRLAILRPPAPARKGGARKEGAS